MVSGDGNNLSLYDQATLELNILSKQLEYSQLENRDDEQGDIFFRDFRLGLSRIDQVNLTELHGCLSREFYNLVEGEKVHAIKRVLLTSYEIENEENVVWWDIYKEFAEAMKELNKSILSSVASDDQIFVKKWWLHPYWPSNNQEGRSWTDFLLRKTLPTRRLLLLEATSCNFSSIEATAKHCLTILCTQLKEYDNESPYIRELWGEEKWKTTPEMSSTVSSACKYIYDKFHIKVYGLDGITYYAMIIFLHLDDIDYHEKCDTIIRQLIEADQLAESLFTSSDVGSPDQSLVMWWLHPCCKYSLDQVKWAKFLELWSIPVRRALLLKAAICRFPYPKPWFKLYTSLPNLDSVTS